MFTNKALTARCLVVKRKLKREFAVRPATMFEKECRWRKIGVYATCEKLAKRYNVELSHVVGFCNPAM